MQRLGEEKRNRREKEPTHEVNFGTNKMEFLRQPKPMTLEGCVATEWTQFKDNFDIYSIATGCSLKEESIKAATLLYCLGQSARDVLDTLEPTKEEKASSKEIIKKLDEYFIPKKNKTVERHKFNTRGQQANENIDQYLGELRKLAQNCEFGTMKDDLIMDRIICGIKDNHLRDKLLREKDLTLDKAVAVCKAAEQTEAHLKELYQNGKELNTVEVRQRPNHPQPGRHQDQHYPSKLNKVTSNYAPRINKFIRNCNRCGLKHERRKCPAYGKVCLKCSKANHFAKQCNSKLVNVVTENDIIESENYVLDCITNNQLSDYKDAFWKNISIVNCNKSFKAKVDTGAQINVIPNYIFDKLQLRTKLQKCVANITNYGGDKLKVIGDCILDVKIDNKQHKMHFFVIDTPINSTPIVGIKTIQELDLLRTINIVNRVEANTDEIVLKYDEVFTGLGKINIEPYEFKLKENYTPIVVPPRQVPFQLVEPLKNELNKMMKDKIITKISEPTEFVNPLVLVKKKSGNEIRICLDPKNLNKAIRREHYKIPTFEELTHKINGSKYFTTLDANKGFWQIALSESASKLTTFATPHGRFRFQRLPFGLSCAPEIFQKTFTEIFNDITGVSIYIDDLIIFAKDKKEHDEILIKVLERAKERGVRFNKEKCKFAVSEMKYVGHILTQNGIKPDSHKHLY